MDALEFRCKGKGINFLKHKKAKNKKVQHFSGVVPSNSY